MSLLDSIYQKKRGSEGPCGHCWFKIEIPWVIQMFISDSSSLLALPSVSLVEKKGTNLSKGRGLVLMSWCGVVLPSPSAKGRNTDLE